MARRAGRKRKSGRREPSGRVQRQPRGETEWATMAPVLERRCRELGWEPTPDNMRRVRSPEAGTPWGKLYLRGLLADPDAPRHLRADQARDRHDAATWFANLRHDYLRSIYAPTPAILDMEPGQRGRALIAESAARDRAIRAAYRHAEDALRASGRKPMRAVLALLFEDGICQGIHDVRVGLDALHEARMGGVDNAREIRHRVTN